MTVFARVLLLAGLGMVWYRVVQQLAPEWSLNPQYHYGWAVPALCAYLVWRNYSSSMACTEAGAQLGPVAKVAHVAQVSRPAVSQVFKPAVSQVYEERTAPGRFVLAVAGVAALLYAPTRLIQESNPDWRLVSWALAIEAVVLTLVAGWWWRRGAGAGFGPMRWREAFPVLFFLVAVPWPTLLEAPLVEGLSRVNATAAAEVLGWLGLPALQHGNVVEVATGMVGIEQACSGVRSLQVTVMLALFFGELYRLRFPGRLLAIGAAAICALLFNIGRTGLLAVVAARVGLPALERWHEPAGAAVLVGCFVAVWALCRFAGRPAAQLIAEKPVHQLAGLPVYRSTAPSIFWSTVLLAWVLVVELGTETWYRWHERHLPDAVTWDVQLPAENPTLRQVQLPERATQLLRCDIARNAAWDDAAHWQAIYLRWRPGRTAAGLARAHLPETCLPAAGLQLESAGPPFNVTVMGLDLPVRLYHAEPGPLHVLYCLWEERAPAGPAAAQSLTWHRRLGAALAGGRNTGQCSLELALWDVADEASARERLVQQFQAMVRVELPEGQWVEKER